MDNEPTFQSPSGQSAQVSAHPSGPAPSSSAQTPNFVTSEQLLAISDKWAEQFARMEALLSRGNDFSTPVSSVKPVDKQNLISETPFLAPATRPTGPVEVPVAVEALVKSKSVDQKDKKKSHKSRKDKPADKVGKTDYKILTTDSKQDKKRDIKSEKKGLLHRVQSPLLRNRDVLLPLRLIPATVRSLLISHLCLKGTVVSFPQALIDFLPVPPTGDHPLFHNRTRNRPLPVLVLIHRLQKLLPMNKSLTMIWTSQSHFPAQMRDNYQIPLKHRNKLRICHTGKQSDLSELIWAGITFRHLKLTIQSQTSLIIPGRAKTPENLRGYLSPCPQMISYARNCSAETLLWQKAIHKDHKILQGSNGTSSSRCLNPSPNGTKCTY